MLVSSRALLLWYSRHLVGLDCARWLSVFSLIDIEVNLEGYLFYSPFHSALSPFIYCCTGELPRLLCEVRSTKLLRSECIERPIEHYFFLVAFINYTMYIYIV